MSDSFENPFRPGAGHPPPYLAGRENEQSEFRRLLDQRVVLENVVLTGLRGVGKTVLLNSLKPIAIESGWLWTGTDISEAASISEKNLAIRIITDISTLTSNLTVDKIEDRKLGFKPENTSIPVKLDYELLAGIFERTPGLVEDKLKAVLEAVWSCVGQLGVKGIVLAYDEAQNFSDQAKKDEHPLSILLDVFQSIQKKEIPIMLVLTGLPTLFPKLVTARTFSERMFRVITIEKLTDSASEEAIQRPISRTNCPVAFTEHGVSEIVRLSAGYPYFIQFICKEAFDIIIQKVESAADLDFQFDGIIRKLDTDFFAGRWNRTTDRQRELMKVISKLPNCDDEFTVQEIVEMSATESSKPFSKSHISQLLRDLANAGLIYKTRFGNHSFAVPLLGQFINRLQNQSRLF